MRELDECRAEVFRRSEKRIHERRKKRNRALALCAPLCLIVTVCSVMLLPTMLSGRSKDMPKYGEMEIADSSGQSMYHSYVQVEIQNTDSSPAYYRKVTDYSEVTEVFELIHDLTFVDGIKPGDNYDLNAGEEANSQTGTANESIGSKEYMITFTTVYGEEQFYVLDGSELLDEDTGVKILLSDEQLSELKAVLGLPQ